jgi:hypothetical protein
VGKDKPFYNLHKDLLVQKSPFLKSRLDPRIKGHWDEEFIDLPEADTPSFDTLVKWMYSGRVPDCITLERIATTYNLATKFGMLDCQNDLADALYNRFRSEAWSPPSVEAKAIYVLAAEGSLLQKCVLDLMAFDVCERAGDADVDGVSSLLGYSDYENMKQHIREGGIAECGFSAKLAHQVISGDFGTSEPTDNYKDCEYHVHTDGTLCPGPIWRKGFQRGFKDSNSITRQHHNPQSSDTVITLS